MVKRPMWLAAGLVIGAGGTLWAERRVRAGARRLMDRLSPEHVTAGSWGTARKLGGRVREAVDAGRAERGRREEELWQELGARLGPPADRSPLRPPGGRGEHR